MEANASVLGGGERRSKVADLKLHSFKCILLKLEMSYLLCRMKDKGWS